MSKDQKNPPGKANEKKVENSPKSLAGFMKKQAVAKAVKAKDMKALKKAKIDEKENEENEALENAKKESNASAADFNKSEMIKRMILESIVRYTALVILIVCVAMASIKIIPAIITFFYHTIRSLFTL